MLDNSPETKITLSGVTLNMPDPLKPLTEPAGRMFESALGEPLKVAGSMLGDWVYLKKIENLVRIGAKVRKLLDSAHIQPKAVAPDFMLPYIESAGNASNDELQDLWAKLLKSAFVDAQNCHPIYIDTLRRLNGVDARTLQRLVQGLISEDSEEWTIETQHSVARLISLGLAMMSFRELHRTSKGTTITKPADAQLTKFGRQFVEALGVYQPGETHCPPETDETKGGLLTGLRQATIDEGE